MSRYSDNKTSGSDSLCEVTCIDEKRVSSVRGKMEDDEILVELAELFRALGDLTRAKILRALSISELCVCDLAAVVGLSQSAVSHQLRFLRMARLVRYRKEGKMAYYSLDDEHIHRLFDQGLSHVTEKFK